MKHKTPIQIRFKDVDALGHVNNANHLTYFESARIDYFESLIAEKINWERDGMILARQTVDYKKPIYFHDKIFVYTWLIKIGNTSFELGYQLIREEKDGAETELATGTSVIVCFSYKENKPVPVPDSWRRKMEGSD